MVLRLVLSYIYVLHFFPVSRVALNKAVQYNVMLPLVFSRSAPCVLERDSVEVPRPAELGLDASSGL